MAGNYSDAHTHRDGLVADTLALGLVGEGTMRKMATSLHPVELSVVRHMVKIQSSCHQLLPVYRQNGSFYIAMHLHKGTNWLNGLPRGRYFINHKPIVID